MKRARRNFAPLGLVSCFVLTMVVCLLAKVAGGQSTVAELAGPLSAFGAFTYVLTCWAVSFTTELVPNEETIHIYPLLRRPVLARADAVSMALGLSKVLGVRSKLLGRGTALLTAGDRCYNVRSRKIENVMKNID